MTTTVDTPTISCPPSVDAGPSNASGGESGGQSGQLSGQPRRSLEPSAGLGNLQAFDARERSEDEPPAKRRNFGKAPIVVSDDENDDKYLSYADYEYVSKPERAQLGPSASVPVAGHIPPPTIYQAGSAVNPVAQEPLHFAVNISVSQQSPGVGPFQMPQPPIAQTQQQFFLTRQNLSFFQPELTLQSGFPSQLGPSLELGLPMWPVLAGTRDEQGSSSSTFAARHMPPPTVYQAGFAANPVFPVS